MKPDAQERIAKKIEEVKTAYGNDVLTLLKQINTMRLAGKGRVALAPVVDRASLRWVLAWKRDKISYDLNVIVRFDDNGETANIAGVWVHCHASSPLEFEGHTPTTWMRRLTGLSIKGIREAIDAEWGR